MRHLTATSSPLPHPRRWSLPATPFSLLRWHRRQRHGGGGDGDGDGGGAFCKIHPQHQDAPRQSPLAPPLASSTRRIVPSVAGFFPPPEPVDLHDEGCDWFWAPGGRSWHQDWWGIVFLCFFFFYCFALSLCLFWLNWVASWCFEIVRRDDICFELMHDFINQCWVASFAS